MTLFKIGSRVSKLADSTRQGLVKRVNHTPRGTFVKVQWDDGIKEFRVLTTDLSLEAPIEPTTNEVDVLREAVNGRSS